LWSEREAAIRRDDTRTVESLEQRIEKFVTGGPLPGDEPPYQSFDGGPRRSVTKPQDMNSVLFAHLQNRGTRTDDGRVSGVEINA
jgi:hypothetical protein